MDLPAFATPGTAAKPEEKDAAAKSDDKKPNSKAKAPTGLAQDAAKALLEKLRAGKRK